MLECSNLTVAFDGIRALDGASLTVPLGSVTAVMGPSGCGKSTLLRTIAGLQRPDAGSVVWQGRDLAGVPPHLRNFGLMFQDYALFPHLDVAENVAFGLRMQGTDPSAISERVGEVLELVGLTGFEHRAIDDLSGGEQQRVSLARTLAPRPELLLLDEPLGALDRTLRNRLLTEMRQIIARLDVTAVYVTHDTEEAFGIADRVAVMAAGRVMQVGTASDVWSQPADPLVAELVGHPNVVNAADLRTAGVFDHPHDEPVMVPRDVIAVSADPPHNATVVESRFAADRFEVTIDVGGLELHVFSAHHLEPGAAVSVSVDDVVAFGSNRAAEPSP